MVYTQMCIRDRIYIVGKAFEKLYPNERMEVNYQLANSMFCDFIGKEVTEEFVKKLNIPVVGLVDTNWNPEEVDYAIPVSYTHLPNCKYSDFTDYGVKNGFDLPDKECQMCIRDRFIDVKNVEQLEKISQRRMIIWIW